MVRDNKIEFRHEDGDWEIFREKMECYLLQENVTNDEIKFATLVTELDNDAHALLNQLITSAKAITKIYTDLTRYVTRLKKLALLCNI